MSAVGIGEISLQFSWYEFFQKSLQKSIAYDRSAFHLSEWILE
jgi:hypothetical protein